VIVVSLLEAYRRGDFALIDQIANRLEGDARLALEEGPTQWIPARLLQTLVARFRESNLRAVLPEGGTERWTPLIESFLRAPQPVFEFFPSQQAAIARGVLDAGKSFSVQMPTGSGKTALCETILFDHASSHPSSGALLLVPFRSLAAELKGSVAPRLKDMGVVTRAVYGGTVPTRDDVHSLDDTQVLITTPESLSGVLSASPPFLNRIQLVICDEGHLLDGGSRGVGLELLLARLLARDIGPPRFVFVSAIVPNIEEINIWLGGTPDTVVRSTYRPAVADYAVLSAEDDTTSRAFALAMNPHRNDASAYAIEGFLRSQDFRYYNAPTRRTRTYGFTSVKTRAVATARKALPMGTTALFASMKRGPQGAIGLAIELVEQLSVGLSLPVPRDYCDEAALLRTLDYLRLEFGPDWIGSRSLECGAVLHHGDVPQEAREVLEPLIRTGAVKLAICTSTLAEGVNLPIRTLVLYSVERRSTSGSTPLLARDIKNLVGRAGRAGSSTNGLVIVANEEQWPQVTGVAADRDGEPVYGSLGKLLSKLQTELAFAGIEFDDSVLERDPDFHPLADGVDACLLDLMAVEVGEARLHELALEVVSRTFAYTRSDAGQKALLNRVFLSRASRLTSLSQSNRIGWLRDSGVRARLVSSVETQLLPAAPDWTGIVASSTRELIDTLLAWCILQPEVRSAMREKFRLKATEDLGPKEALFKTIVSLWLGGARFGEIAADTGIDINDVLAIHSGAIAFALQTTVEQGVAILSHLLAEDGVVLSEAITAFPDRLRFGSQNDSAVSLMQGGIRHRSAAIALAEDPVISEADAPHLVSTALRVLQTNRRDLVNRLGELVVERTEADLTPHR
jgi:helicase